MFDYYTYLMVLSWASLAILSILIWENNRIKNKDKRIFYLSYFLIAISGLSELVGLKINGNLEIPYQVLIATKTIDYILTPLAGGVIAKQIRLKNIPDKVLTAILCFNVIFQLVSIPMGWMVEIDDNHNYSHGPLYFVYMIVYFAIITVVIIQFILYGQKFKKHNRLSLNCIMLFMIAGILIQELLGGEYRTAYISFAMGASLLFIHYSEYSQIASDERIEKQSILITTDALTGVYSRFAYVQVLKQYSSIEKMPSDLALFMIDVNGLKNVNDNKGHEAGDKMICNAANYIKSVFGIKGRVFRIGGDEFVVFTETNRAGAEKIVARLDGSSTDHAEEMLQNISLATGFALASEYPKLNCERLARIADEEMYKAKTEYYLSHKIERRKQ